MSRVIKPQSFLRGLDEVCQLLHEVGQLLYDLLTASGGVAGGHKIITIFIMWEFVVHTTIVGNIMQTCFC